MASVTDCLVQLQQLTRQNLDILQAINDAFLSNQTHLTAKIGDVKYAIPSFISLENKINNLQDNFNNLINAPKTGEATFNLDGNSRTIEVRGYTHTPNSLVLNGVSKFNIEQNDIFKDFLTPVPYITFSLQNLPNDITSVNIKKIVPKTDEMRDIFKNLLVNDQTSQTSKSLSYADLYKKLYIYKEDKDYIEYDTVKKLPIRKNIGSATYVIGSIKSDVIDENLDEYITLQLRNNLDLKNDSNYTNKLTYRLFDETIEKPLAIGDQLVTFDDSAKVQITEIQQNTNTITVKVLNGEYLNLAAEPINTTPISITDLAKLKFYSPIDFNDDKYIKIPLEEDQYIFIAIAPLNDRMNIQASWGTGIILNTYALKNDDNQSFQDYYQKNVRNIGDALNELVMVSPGELTKLSGEDFQSLQRIKPIINKEYLNVVQINKHLNDTTTVKNIKSLYAQKLKYSADLQDIQNKISDINNKLSAVSFDDTSNIKTVYTQQLSEYTKTKNSLVTSLQKIMDEISLAANSSDIPIENAKYHIRGFFDYVSFANTNKLDESRIKGIRVQYRYKNLDKAVGNATSIADKFLFSDWTEMKGFLNTKEVSWDNGYQFNIKKDTSNENEPSFNQIDIAISQGETVDIRLQVIYDYGYPYAEVTSEWSDIINIEFPQEFLKDIQVLDIISENNSDIETNRFNNILIEQGITEHIGDKIQDQDITYYHNPENISSGFYTSERRVIPLKDKLTEFSNLLTQLKDEVAGTNSSALSVSIGVGDISNKIYPLQSNNILVEGYKDLIKDQGTINTVINNYTIDENQIISTLLNISITNNSEHTMKLYPMFPGSSNEILNNKTNYKYNANEYTLGGFASSGDIVTGLTQLREYVDKLDKSNKYDHTRFSDDILDLYKQIGGQSGTGLTADHYYVKQVLSKDIYAGSMTAQNNKIAEVKPVKDTNGVVKDIYSYDLPLHSLAIEVPFYDISTPSGDPNNKANQCYDFVTGNKPNNMVYIDDVSLEIQFKAPKGTTVLDKITIKSIKYHVYTYNGASGKYALCKNPEDSAGYYTAQGSDLKFYRDDKTPWQDNTITGLTWEIVWEATDKIEGVKASNVVFEQQITKMVVKLAAAEIGKNASGSSYTAHNTSTEGTTFMSHNPVPDLDHFGFSDIISNSADTTSIDDSGLLTPLDTTTNDVSNSGQSPVSSNIPYNYKLLDNAPEKWYNKGVWMKVGGQENVMLQRCNQFINFRTYSIIGTTKFYNENPANNIYVTNNILSGIVNNEDTCYMDLYPTSIGVSLYPSISNEKSLICNNIGTISYQLLNPGDTIVIPMLLKYKLGEWSTAAENQTSELVDKATQVSKTISFDLLPSLYQDPINYEFTVTCKFELTPQDRALMNNRKYTEDIKYTTTVTK